MPEQKPFKLPDLSTGSVQNIGEIIALIQLVGLGVRTVTGLVKAWLGGQSKGPDGQYAPDAQLIADYIESVEKAQAASDALKSRMQAIIDSRT